MFCRYCRFRNSSQCPCLIPDFRNFILYFSRKLGALCGDGNFSRTVGKLNNIKISGVNMHLFQRDEPVQCWSLPGFWLSIRVLEYWRQWLNDSLRIFFKQGNHTRFSDLINNLWTLLEALKLGLWFKNLFIFSLLP